ncbi:MAG: periplasmic heavy metal sensor [Pseudomonadota bacterium]
MSRTLTIIFALSILLNVFAVGLFSGRFLGGTVFSDHSKREVAASERHFGGPDNPFQLIRLASALPEDTRRAFRGELKAHLKDMRKGQKDLWRIRNAVAEQLTTEEWDRAALEALLDELDAAEQSQRAVFHDVFLNALETLTPDQRMLLFEMAREHRGRGRHGMPKGGPLMAGPRHGPPDGKNHGEKSYEDGADKNNSDKQE